MTSLREIAVVSFTHHLVTATVNLQLHSPGSPHVQVNLEALRSSLIDAEQTGVPMPLQLVFGGGQIHHQGKALRGPSLQAGHLLRLCEERSIKSLTFDPKLETAEILRFLILLKAIQKRDAFDRGKIAAAFGVAGIRHVSIDTADPPACGPPRDDKEMPPAGLGSYQALAECVQDNHALAMHGRALDVNDVMGVVEQTAQDLMEGPSGLLGLASHDNVDRFTVGHSVRVALLALQVGRAADVSQDELIRVGTAALLHDIGKSKVPQEILFKAGRLEQEEWREMAKHPRLGAEILLEQRELDPSAVGTAFCHHLAPAGVGYPRPEFPFEPSGVSKLVRVCDVFEALTSVRPYKKALTPIEAYTVMFRNEADFDPRWLRFFVRVLGLYPTGLRVRLTCGQEAVVTGPGRTLHQPWVEIPPSGDASPPLDGAPDTFEIGAPVDGVVHEIQSVITQERTVAVGEEEAQILTQHSHGACLGRLGEDPDSLPQ